MQEMQTTLTPYQLSLALDLGEEIFSHHVVTSALTNIVLEGTEPEMVVIVCYAVVKKEDAEAIGGPTYRALSEEMTKTYGLSSNQKPV